MLIKLDNFFLPQIRKKKKKKLQNDYKYYVIFY